MENIEYDLTDIQEHFQNYDTPQETSAKIGRVAMLLTSWFVKIGDPCSNVLDLKEAIDFLHNLSMTIDCVKPVTKEP